MTGTDQSTMGRFRSAGMFCPACGSLMYRARLLKGYPKTGEGSERMTCALHGPLGSFRHLGTDRAAPDEGAAVVRRVMV